MGHSGPAYRSRLGNPAKERMHNRSASPVSGNVHAKTTGIHENMMRLDNDMVNRLDFCARV